LRARDDLGLIEACVREAGAIARSYFGGEYKKWDKGKGQLVTDADLAVDKYLRETLSAARPGYGWLSEETEDNPRRLQTEFTFVVDPIDGTVAFLKGRPHFTICAAVVHEGVPLAGVVYNPISEECFTAAAGEGAKLNGAPIRTSRTKALENSRMLGDKAMFVHPAWNDAPLTPWPAMIIETRGSIAYRMALVANGNFDAMLALSAKRDWDLAAGDLIVREAGGCVSAHTGAALRYNGPETVQPSVVAAGAALHPLLLDRVRNLKLPRG
jgi:myo-inositol-1(or 4)-monophosphatase